MADHNFQSALALWAKQTIAYALSLTAQEDGQALDNPAQVLHARNAMERIASELWEDTAKESSEPARFMLLFVRRVFDWVQDHRQSKS